METSPYKEFKNTAYSGANNMLEKVKDEAGHLETQLKDRYRQVKASANGAYKTTVNYIEENPVQSVLTAAAIGFIVSSIIRRK